MNEKSELMEEKDALEGTLEFTRRENVDLTTENFDIKQEKGDLEAEKIELMNEKSELMKEKDALEGQNDKLTNNNNRLKKEIEDTSESLKLEKNEKEKYFNDLQGIYDFLKCGPGENEHDSGDEEGDEFYDPLNLETTAECVKKQI